MANVGQLGDRAGHASTTTGAGTITLGAALGAVAPNLCSFQSFASAGITDQMIVSYLILDLNGAWEVGRGTYSSSGTTLTRGPTFSSNSNAAISLSGNEQILLSFIAEDAVALGLNFYAGGRLTLVTATPVLTSNQTAKTSIFYTPFLHNLISIYDGFQFQTYAFSESSVALDSSNFLSGNNYDLFMALNAGVPTLGYGPAWTNATTRSAATALTRVNGVNVNNTTITLRTASGTTFSAATNKAFYVGTAHATANGQTGMGFILSAAGGGGNVLGLFNAYNQVPVNAASQDSTASWLYSTATFRAANNNANNSISFIDGLGIISTTGSYAVNGGFNSGSAVTVEPEFGAAFNWSSGAPVFAAAMEVTDQSSSFFTELTGAAPFAFAPALGFNVITAIESGSVAGTLYTGAGFQQLTASLWM